MDLLDVIFDFHYYLIDPLDHHFIMKPLFSSLYLLISLSSLYLFPFPFLSSPFQTHTLLGVLISHNSTSSSFTISSYVKVPPITGTSSRRLTSTLIEGNRGKIDVQRKMANNIVDVVTRGFNIEDTQIYLGSRGFKSIKTLI